MRSSAADHLLRKAPHIMQFKPSSTKLTAKQTRMYSMEKLNNFRWVFKALAAKSPYIVSSEDLADSSLCSELADIGQYTILAQSPLPLRFVYEHLDLLLERKFPLEDYNSLRGSELVSSFHGQVADTFGFIAYRPTKHQLLLSFAGTSNLKQAYYDVRATHHPYPAGEGCTIHTGFWLLYQGIKTAALGALNAAMQKRDVDELVVSGHSMGAALSYLLSLDIITADVNVSQKPIIHVVVFGSPRLGNLAFREHWRQAVLHHRTRYGPSSFREHSIKAYNDGVPSLPPVIFNYHHLSENTLYSNHDQLYHIPPSFSDDSFFMIKEPSDELMSEYPKGGHNYYSGLDVEKFIRRMRWLSEFKDRGHGWEDLYSAHVIKQEQGV